MNPELIKKFTEDPDWVHVENLILKYLEPLETLDCIDASQPADTVKAQVMGNQTVVRAMKAFLKEAKILTRDKKKVSFR